MMRLAKEERELLLKILLDVKKKKKKKKKKKDKFFRQLHFTHLWFASNLICLLVILFLTLYPPVISFVTAS